MMEEMRPAAVFASTGKSENTFSLFSSSSLFSHFPSEVTSDVSVSSLSLTLSPLPLTVGSSVSLIVGLGASFLRCKVVEI